jgi:MFS family permease
LIALVGLAPCFILNGISYVAVVIMLWRMRVGELHSTPPLRQARGQLREGFRYVVSTPVLRNTLIMLAIIGTLTYEFQVSLPLIAEFTFHGDASSYAFLTATMGIGAVLGGIFIAGQKQILPSRLVRGAFLFGVTVLAAAFMPSLALAGFILVLVGICSIYFTSLGNSILQLESSPQMRGRVMAFWSIAFLGSTTIGGPLVGWFAEIAGPRWGLALGGVAALTAAVIGAATLRNNRPRKQISDGPTPVSAN